MDLEEATPAETRSKKISSYEVSQWSGSRVLDRYLEP